MRKKVLSVAFIWFVVVVAVGLLYLLREKPPVKEFIAWALGVWPLLAFIGAVAIAISGWVIRHDFRTKPKVNVVTQDILKELRRLRAEGVNLRNEVQYHIASYEGLVIWQRGAATWLDNVVAQVEQIDQNWAGRIETLNTFQSNQAPVRNPVGRLVEGIEHQRWADIQNERLARLEAFLKHLTSRGPWNSNVAPAKT